MSEVIPRTALLSYGAVGFPIAFAALPFVLYLPNAYSTQYGISIELVGLILLITRVLDVISDPVAGILTDRVPIFGFYRKSWFILSIPISLLSMWMLFNPPNTPNALHLLIWSSLLYLGWSFTQIPYKAWGAELSKYYHQRSRITGSTELAAIIGTISVASVPFIFQTNSSETLIIISWWLLITFPIFSLISIYVVEEPKDTLRNPEKISFNLIWENWSSCFKIPDFTRLLTSYFFSATANSLTAVLVIFYITYVLKSQPGIFLFALFFASGLSFFAWLSLGRIFGKKACWQTGLLLSAASFVGVPFLTAGEDIYYLLMCIFVGIGLASDAIFPPSMLADIIDHGTLDHMEQRSGVFFSIWGSVTKIALIVPVGIAMPFLGIMGFDPSEDEATQMGLYTLVFLYAIVPILLKLLAAIWIRNYQLSEEEQKNIQLKIARKKNGNNIE